MENKEFKKLISRILEPYGFKREKNVWYRRQDGVLAVLEIDKNPYCAGWFIDVGAEFAHTEHELLSSNLDFSDICVFPSDPTSYNEWKQCVHTIPRKSPAEPYIRLDIFSDAEIEEYLRFNIQRSLVPMLTKESLLEMVHKDPYYLYVGKEKNLPLYGFTEEEIRLGNAHCR